MPFFYLRLIKIFTSLCYFYGFFAEFRLIENSVMKYLAEFPSNAYYDYAKICFYYALKCFYAANLNMQKEQFFLYEIDRMKRRVNKTFE